MFRRSRDFFTDILRQTDLVLLALCAAASLFGILMVASATRYMHTWRLVAVQSAALLLGVILYLLVSQVDLNDLSKYWKWIFLTGIIFILLLVTPLGIEDNTGNRAWLDFPFLPVKVQPAEIVKLTFTLVLAKQLAWLKENRDLSSIPSILFLGVHFGVIFLLFYKVSSDMGSALVFLFIFICMCFIAGVALHWFAIGGVLGTMVFGVVATLIYSVAADRMEAFTRSNIGVSMYVIIALLGCVAAVLGIYGDLFASVVKRQCGIKDYGTIFPGHGGILDRFDSVMFIAPFVTMVITAVFYK